MRAPSAIYILKRQTYALPQLGESQTAQQCVSRIAGHRLRETAAKDAKLQVAAELHVPHIGLMTLQPQAEHIWTALQLQDPGG